MNSSTLGRHEIRRKFIRLVKAHPILWVHTIGKIHEKYRPEKNKIWNMISAEMGIPYEKLRKMWEGLRYQYKRDLKLFGSKSTWVYFSDMDFLRETKYCTEDVVHYSDSEDTDTEEMYKEWSLTRPTTSCSSNLLPTNAAGTAFGVENQPLETTTTSNCEIKLSSSTEDLEFLSNIDENVVKQEPELDLEPYANATRGEQQDHIHKTDENVVKQEPELDLEPYANATRGEQQDHIHKTDENVVKQEHELDLEPYANATRGEQQDHIHKTDENVVKQEPELDLEPHANATRGEQQDHIHKTDNVHCSIEFQEPSVSTSNHKSSSMPVQEISNRPAATISNFQRKPDTDFNIKDDDYYFVMSILPSLKQIPRDRKFPTRVGILSLIEEALSEVCDQQ